MGKKQHQKDRLFLTNKEWKEEWGGFKDKQHVPNQRLPFYCCAISFTNFEDPVCTSDGTVFDVTNIVPYISKFHAHPVNGDPLELSDLIPLTFHKNADGEYECPIMKKVFNQVRQAAEHAMHSHIRQHCKPECSEHCRHVCLPLRRIWHCCALLFTPKHSDLALNVLVHAHPHASCAEMMTCCSTPTLSQSKQVAMSSRMKQCSSSTSS
jgi:U-box domain